MSNNQKDLRLLNELLNAFFDVYSEDNFNQVLAEFNIVNMMEQGAVFFKNKVFISVNKKIFEEKKNYERSEVEDFKQTLLNLKRFIKYKRKIMKC